jgi:hypothetical protein
MVETNVKSVMYLFVMTIVEAARKLANDNAIIKSYINFDEGKQYWIFTTNPNLLPSAQTLKPITFPSKRDQMNNWWKGLNDRQKRVLYSHINKERYPERIADKDYDKIKAVYDNWPLKYTAVYYGVKGWSCNQFVGETFFIAGKNLIHNKKYYSAKDIWEAKYSLISVDKTKVQPGDIAAFGGTHVEIVTKVDGNNFCSIGAGRGSSGWLGLWSGDGVEVCGWEPVAKNRYINDNAIRFRRVS